MQITMAAFLVTLRADVDKGNVRILAPEGFLREAVSENLPRANHVAPLSLSVRRHPAKGPLGHIDCGLGKSIPQTDDLIGRRISLTGMSWISTASKSSSNTLGTEAPAEMNLSSGIMALYVAKLLPCTTHCLSVALR